MNLSIIAHKVHCTQALWHPNTDLPCATLILFTCAIYNFSSFILRILIHLYTIYILYLYIVYSMFKTYSVKHLPLGDLLTCATFSLEERLGIVWGSSLWKCRTWAFWCLLPFFQEFHKKILVFPAVSALSNMARSTRSATVASPNKSGKMQMLPEGC